MKALLLSLVVSLSALLHAETVPEMADFANGRTFKYTSKDHPKADGLIINFKVPESWVGKEGERPHIVQKFLSSKEGYKVMVALMVRNPAKAQGEKITDAEILASLEPEEYKKGLVQGMVLIDSKPTKIDGLPGCITRIAYHSNVAGTEVDQLMVDYAFVYDSKLINLLCSVATSSKDQVPLLPQHLADLSPVFFQIANSVVVENRWK